jgi:hypothetical protein
LIIDVEAVRERVNVREFVNPNPEDLVESLVHELAHVLLVNPKADLLKPYTRKEVDAIARARVCFEEDELKVAAITATAMEKITGRSWAEWCLVAARCGISFAYQDQVDPRTIFENAMRAPSTKRWACSILRALHASGVLVVQG